MGLGKQLVVGAAACFGVAVLVLPPVFIQYVRYDATRAAAERIHEMNEAMAEMDDPHAARDYFEADHAEDGVGTVEVRRMTGAYYPEDTVEQSDSGASMLAIGLSGLGGLLVFGIAGGGAYTLLSLGREDEVQPVDAIDGEGLADADFGADYDTSEAHFA